MPDTPFKSMSREPRSKGEKLLEAIFGTNYGNSVPCEKCGGKVYEGDWPFCRGQASDHRRD